MIAVAASSISRGADLQLLGDGMMERCQGPVASSSRIVAWRVTRGWGLLLHTKG